MKTKKKQACKTKAKSCSHETVSITWHPETGQEMSRRCSPTTGCGEQLPLGKTKGKPNVVELRAARLAAGVRSRKIERLGMTIHAVDCEGINDDCPATVNKPNDLEAGWLCHEIITHDEDREIRDARSYSWDISRPIADQASEIKAQYNAFGKLYNAFGKLYDAVKEVKETGGSKLLYGGGTKRLYGDPVTESELRDQAGQLVDQKLEVLVEHAVVDEARVTIDVTQHAAIDEAVPDVDPATITHEQCSRCGQQEHAEVDEARTALCRAMLAGDPATIAEGMSERGHSDETIRVDLGLVAVDLEIGDDEPPTSEWATGCPVTLHERDANWHDGAGWYYTIDDYPDEGSCGAFATREETIAHARAAGYEPPVDISDAALAAIAHAPAREPTADERFDIGGES